MDGQKLSVPLSKSQSISHHLRQSLCSQSELNWRKNLNLFQWRHSSPKSTLKEQFAKPHPVRNFIFHKSALTSFMRSLLSNDSPLSFINLSFDLRLNSLLPFFFEKMVPIQTIPNYTKAKEIELKLKARADDSNSERINEHNRIEECSVICSGRN